MFKQLSLIPKIITETFSLINNTASFLKNSVSIEESGIYFNIGEKKLKSGDLLIKAGTALNNIDTLRLSEVIDACYKNTQMGNEKGLDRSSAELTDVIVGAFKNEFTDERIENRPDMQEKQNLQIG